MASAGPLREGAPACAPGAKGVVGVTGLGDAAPRTVPVACSSLALWHGGLWHLVGVWVYTGRARGGDARVGDEGEGGVVGRCEVVRAVADGLGGRLEGREVGESEGEGVHGGEAPGGCAEWRQRESLATLLVLILSSLRPPVLPDTGYDSVLL